MCTRRLALAIAAHHLLASDGFAVPSCRVASSGVARMCGASRTYTDLQMLKVERYPDPFEEERGKKREEQAIADRDSGDGITIIEHTDVTGPTASLAPDEVVPILMNALQNNDVPTKDAGLRLVWAFATETTQYVFDNNRTEFFESCHDTADEFPTSFYGAALHGQSWDLETQINRVGGESGWIATQVMKTISSDGRLRRWQWELRKNRRPPQLGCWKVESIGSSDRNGDFEARDRGTGWSD
ncbi:hypothetical protein ACHAXT_001209 [Thalassiosira profunda]